MSKYAELFKAAKSAGEGAGKVAAELRKLLKGKRKAQAESIKEDAYAEFLAGRKTKELPEADRRTYEAMRTGFSRYFKAAGWTAKKTVGNTGTATKPAEVNHAAMLQWIDAGIESVTEADAADFAVDAAIKLLKDFRAQFNTLKPSK